MFSPEIESAALAQIVRRYPALGGYGGIVRNGLSPNTAACVFETEAGRFFAKRYDPDRVEAHSLLWEHSISLQLRAADYPTPVIHANNRGDTLTWLAENPYAIYSLAVGEDRYGEYPVFSPFLDREDARAAGRWLARFHRVMAEGPLPLARPFKGLTAQYQVLLAPRYEEALAALLSQVPILEAYVGARPEWPPLVAGLAQDAAHIQRLASDLPVGVIHGDWLKRNMFWRGHDVSDVLDFGMWNVAPWIFDVALALLPVGFNWPELLLGRVSPNHPDLIAFLSGYQSERHFEDSEWEALPWMMQTARLEFYLSAIAVALQKGDQAEAAQFWDLLVATRHYFVSNPAWREVLLS
ncbi:MAG: phosphotransferase [Candidatus Sericytochromatia bacterium]|nr:phosphotransferase [Candidatus Sericytochromatia bacterium]